MRRLLVIDDDESVRETFAFFLGQLGYEVVLAEDGARGVEAFDNFFDGAIVDLIMPAMSGLEVCRILRTRTAEAGRDFPIWVVTSAPTHPSVEAVKKLGVRAVLGKPAVWAQLRGLLEEEFGAG